MLMPEKCTARLRNFENQSAAHFRKSLKKGSVLNMRFDVQTVLEKNPQARAQEAWARAWDPGSNGVCFKNDLKMDPFF